MSREELAEAVALWAADHDDKHREVAFDANHLGKLERGTVRCPRQPYISALCAVLHATPTELGFRSATRLISGEPEPKPSDSPVGESTEPESAASASEPIAGEVISLHHRNFFKYRVSPFQRSGLTSCATSEQPLITLDAISIPKLLVTLRGS
jgi:hypothetical protein